MKSLPKTITYLFLALCAAFIITGQAQTTAFTYQGQLNDGATAANGTYQMQFSLYDAAAAGTQAGTTITNTTVTVLNGIFTVQLNFTAGTPFAAGAARYLEISVKKPADAAYTTLSPRQQITSSPYAIRTISATAADALSAACTGCVTDAQIAGVSGSKVSGTVANAASAVTATTATNANNVTGTVAVANGGTGSTTKNFVDLTTAQTVAGNKTFSNTVTAATFSAGSGGGLILNNSLLKLRDSADSNHGIIYSSTVDGPEFRAFGGFRWANGANGATERMRLDGAGNLTVGGTISGTLADNSVNSEQVTDGSLRLSDTAFFSTVAGAAGATIGPHACASFTFPNGITGLAANDIIYMIPPITSPAGFSFQPVYVPASGAFSYPFCNTLNTNNTLPTQNYRIYIMRP